MTRDMAHRPCDVDRADRYARRAAWGLFAFTALYFGAQIARLIAS